MYISNIDVTEVEVYSANLERDDPDKMELIRLYFERYSSVIAREGVLITPRAFKMESCYILEAVKSEIIARAEAAMTQKHGLVIPNDIEYSIVHDNFVAIVTSEELEPGGLQDAIQSCAMMRSDDSYLALPNNPDFKRGNKAIMFAMAGPTDDTAVDARLYDVHDDDQYNELSEKLRDPRAAGGMDI